MKIKLERIQEILDIVENLVRNMGDKNNKIELSEIKKSYK